MATTSPDVSPLEPRSSSSANGSVDWKSIALPYAIAIGAQIPMLILYARNLHLDKPHYQTFPIAVLATLLIAWSRWPKEAKMPFHRSVLSDVLLVMGLMFAIACVLFFTCKEGTVSSDSCSNTPHCGLPLVCPPKVSVLQIQKKTRTKKKSSISRETETDTPRPIRVICLLP